MKIPYTSPHVSEPLAVAYLAGLPHYAESTRLNIRHALNRLVEFLHGHNQRVQDTTLADLEELRVELCRRLGENTLENYVGNIKRFYQWLEHTHRMLFNPASAWLVPRRKHKLPQVPTEEEIARMLAQPDTDNLLGLRDRAMLEVLYTTGARRSELAALTLDDINLRNGTARLFGKGKKERIAPLGKVAVHWLRRYLAESRAHYAKEHAGKALWFGTRRKPIGPQVITVQLRLYARKAGLSPTFFSPHAFRRACATHMLRHGAHPMMLHQLLGHTRLQTLRPYLQLTVQDLIETHHNSVVGE
jgi:integrase/recombinase XerD